MAETSLGVRWMLVYPKLTDFIPAAELDGLLARAATISGLSLCCQGLGGEIVARSPGSMAEPNGNGVDLLHGKERLGRLTSTGGDSRAVVSEVLQWVADEIQERFRTRREIECLAEHITENYHNLECIFDVIQPLSSLFSLNVVENCQTVLVATSSLVHAERSWLLIAFEDKPELVSLHKTEEGDVLLDSTVLDDSRTGPWEHTFRTGEAINAARSSDIPCGVQLREDLGVTLPLLCLRLEGDRRPLGVLCFSGKAHADFFTSTEVKLTAAITAHIGTLMSNAKLQEDMHSLLLEAITVLSGVMETKDEYTHGHVERVTNYAASIAAHLGFTPEHVERLRIAALLHDLGKIGIPDRVLLKHGDLTEDEKAIMQSHAIAGPRILKHFKHLEPIIPWIQGHHERPDGQGYPLGLKGDAIPIEAQILSVADAFDAMTSNRPYRVAMSIDAAVRRLHDGAGTQFNERVVSAFLETEIFQNLKNGS
ncbi:MAG: HD domain-containing protein [Planctomycetes bacterium]|nr:HD domain-containing protein [Planctomycetota bacterium]